MPEQLFCRIRQKWVRATREERVRQKLLVYLIEDKGYPAEAIAVEKTLAELWPSAARALPRRRADILCFAPNAVAGRPLFPLLLVECKAAKLTPAAIYQAVGYNYFVKAAAVALVAPDDLRTVWVDSTLSRASPGSDVLAYGEALERLL